MALAGSAAPTAPLLPSINPLAEPRFESVGVGMIPRGVVPAMALDRAGFLWLATGDGLVRYDGYRFRPQERASADPAARNLGWIRALLAARDGRLWIGTESAGLAIYDPADESVALQADRPGGGVAPPGPPETAPAPTVLALAEDRDGSIWAGSLGGGLTRFDPASGRSTRYRHGPAAGSLPDDRVLALLVDRQGSLWVGGWQGLSRRLRGSDRFEPVPLTGGAAALAGRVQALLEASDGRIWAGTQQGGLVVLDANTAQGRALADAASEGGLDDGAGRGEVTQLLEAPTGQVWVGRSRGVDWRAVADGRLLRRLRHDPRKPDGLAANHVTSLLQDSAGWVWVGGLGLGLQRHNPHNHSLWVRAADPQAGSPFADPDVRGLLALDNGEVWAATAGSGVAVMDASLQVIGRVGLPAAPGRASRALHVDALAQAGDGTVWLATDGHLLQFNAERRLLRRLAHGAGPVRRLHASRDGTLWLGAQDGLHRLAPGQTTLQRLALAGGQALVGQINALAEDSDGALWVGGAPGLFHLAPGAAGLQAVSSPAGAGLANPTVVGLLLDRRRTLWVDTAVAGLHRMSWDGRQAGFDRISQRHGLLGRPFGANLLQDARGRIWSQMHVYDPAADRLDELTATDGVAFGTGWFYAYAQTRDGRLLFGGSKGLLVVEPEGFDVSAFAPPLVVSELRVNGLRQPAGSIGRGLTLAPQDRSFSVEFAALDYSDPRRLHYTYRLFGFDPEPIAASADLRVASYSNLDPGDYELQVSATNRNGVWSEHRLRLPLHVLPAWWQTAWFRAAAALASVALLVALLAGLLRRRSRQWRRRESVLEQKVAQRTATLETLTRALQLESAALQESSLTDPLTGLRNRRFLTQHIDADIALAVRRHESFRVHGAPLTDEADLVFFLIDIDHFKQLNDLHGHAAGDAVLVQICQRLRTVFREADYLVRWGGEEFLVVARHTARRHAAGLAERACAAVADQPFLLDDGTRLHKSCSIGYAAFPLDPRQPRLHDWSLTLSAADATLYAVKQAGRNAWLGLVGVRADSPQALQALMRRPVAEWRHEAAMMLVHASALADWVRQAPAPAG